MPSLSQLIETAVQYCLKNRGHKQMRTLQLPRGLTIDLYVGAAPSPTTYHQRLRRLAPAWPSEGELATTLRSWPAVIRPPAPLDTKRSTWTDPKDRQAYNCVSMKWAAARVEMGGSQ